MDLKLYLNKNDFSCPQPIKDNKGNIINNINNKSAVVISFIDGKKIDFPKVEECKEVGKMIANLHNLTIKFDKKRKNTLGLNELKKILKKCDSANVKQFENLQKEVDKEINFIENSWPEKLPSGIIHADLFKDNIFFKEEKITGVIDFYFSCYHFFLYDISIVINDWCFEKNGKDFNSSFCKAIIQGYSLLRSITTEEMEAFNVILRTAAVRILITRLHDYIFNPEDAIVIKKDPYQYYNILKWHQNNRI